MKVSLTPPVVTLILSEHKATEKSVNKDQEGNHSCLEGCSFHYHTKAAETTTPLLLT